MSSHSHTRVFESRADALAALRDLEQAGFARQEASLLHAAAGGEVAAGQDAESGIAMGAWPGFGSLWATGWLAASLKGAPAGSLAEALRQAGIMQDEARGMAEALRLGGALVLIRTDAAGGERAATLLANHLAVRSPEHRSEAAGPEGEGPGVLSAPAPGTPGNPETE